MSEIMLNVVKIMEWEMMNYMIRD